MIIAARRGILQSALHRA